jgi:hypothetical protein
VKKVLHMVTLPLQIEGARWFSVIAKYDEFLRNPRMAQEISLAIVEHDQIRTAPKPMTMEFADDIDSVRGLLKKQLCA